MLPKSYLTGEIFTLLAMWSKPGATCPRTQITQISTCCHVYGLYEIIAKYCKHRLLEKPIFSEKTMKAIHLRLRWYWKSPSSLHPISPSSSFNCSCITVTCTGNLLYFEWVSFCDCLQGEVSCSLMLVWVWFQSSSHLHWAISACDYTKTWDYRDLWLWNSYLVVLAGGWMHMLSEDFALINFKHYYKDNSKSFLQFTKMKVIFWIALEK